MTRRSGRSSGSRYRKELQPHGDLLARLRMEAKKGRVTLLFAAKDAEHNNAVVLKELLEQGEH